MINKFFISDTHFGHRNIIKYCKRPFQTVEEMNDKMIQNWNTVIRKEDLVYHLGDIGFGNLELILNSLNGQIILIRGSHDKGIEQHRKRFVKIADLMHIEIEGIRITLCHYAMRTWKVSHYNSWHLYGHSHGQLDPFGKSMDVGVDSNDFCPVSFKRIKGYMALCDDNFNLVKEE